MLQKKQPKNVVIKSTFRTRFPSQSYRVQIDQNIFNHCITIIVSPVEENRESDSHLIT